MSEHTPESFNEPWQYEQNMRGDGVPELDYEITGTNDDFDPVYVGDVFDKAYARRIVACVNACQGLRTEDLEQAWSDGRLFKHLATDDLDALEQSDRADEAERLLRDLATAEQEYRSGHDVHGDGDLRAGRAWDRMRRAGDAARAHLAPPEF